MSSPARLAVTTSLLRLADGHHGFLDTLRAGLWQAYAEAGYPDGATEDGMFEWAFRTMPFETDSPVGRDVLGGAASDLVRGGSSIHSN